VTCKCRCGHGCELLIIEASMNDAEREPRIAERGKPLYDDMSGVNEQIGWSCRPESFAIGGCGFPPLPVSLRSLRVSLA
jgi:hypothetical protein